MLWQMWLLGDTVQNILPLKRLNSREVSHLDLVPLEDGMTRHHPTCKILCDNAVFNEILGKQSVGG